jgi:hypothetical protein
MAAASPQTVVRLALAVGQSPVSRKPHSKSGGPPPHVLTPPQGIGAFTA